MAELRLFLDANVLFTAACSPEGLSALLIELGEAGRVTLLTSPLAIIEAQRNLERKRPAALPRFHGIVQSLEVVREPSPTQVERLAPADLSSKDRPLLAAAIAAQATHFVTGDPKHFAAWMAACGRLPVGVMTPREFLTTEHGQD